MNTHRSCQRLVSALGRPCLPTPDNLSLPASSPCSSLLFRFSNLVLTVESASETVRAVLDDALHRLLRLRVLVHVHGDHGSEDLLLEDLVLGGAGLHHGRLDEVAHAVVETTAGHDRAVGRALRVLDVAGHPVTQCQWNLYIVQDRN